MNIDMKKMLPSDGVEWLYSRVVTKTIRAGRADLDVVVLTQEGDLLALSNQVALVVDAARNIGNRLNPAKI
jgi:acyl-CoA thioesterase